MYRRFTSDDDISTREERAAPAGPPADAGPVIALDDVSLSYPLGESRLEVLRGVDAAFGAGESVAIVGPSGSGKTTLLLLLAGLEQPTGGNIRIGGATLADLDDDALADLRRDRLGIVFQSFHLVPSLTALGNVSLPLEIAGRADAGERAVAMLDRVGLGERRDHYPSQLSGGEQQRVAIARAMVHSPPLLLADEPTGNLDADTGARIIEMLFELSRENGATMLLVTHDDAIAARCDRVLRLRQGRLIESAE